MELGKLARRLCLAVAVFCTVPMAAQSQSTPDATVATPAAAPSTLDIPLPLAGKTLKVAVRYVPPFVFLQDTKVTGFSYDLWNELAKLTGAQTDFRVLETLPQVLDSVKSNQVDLAVYSISITAKRELDYDFSQPMFDSG